MEGERKRKRAEKVEASRAANESKSKEREAAEEGTAAEGPPPTEEEVDEFFAILRRMRDAVKYFEKEGLNSKSGAEEPAVAGGGRKRAAENSGLDLNTVPEAESSSV